MTTVYGAYTRDALEAQYDTSQPIVDGDVPTYLARFARDAERARAAYAHEADLRYGPHPRETIDYFPARVPGAPLFVWIHGGYWRRLSKNEASFVAPPIVDAGGAVAIINYPLAPEASLDTIVASVHRAFTFARALAGERGVDLQRTFVGGHSVGAQLAATVAHAFAISGLVTLSGIYDLEPLLHTSINDAIAMDLATAKRHSPIALPPKAAVALVASAGGREQHEWHRQQRGFVAAWRGWGGDAREIASPDDDHFSIVLELGRASSPLARATRELMGLS